VQSFELMFTWDLMDVQKVLELSLSSPLTMLAMQSSNLTVMTGKVALSRFARIGLLVPVAVVVLVVVSVAVVDSELEVDLAVVGLEVVEALVDEEVLVVDSEDEVDSVGVVDMVDLQVAMTEVLALSLLHQIRSLTMLLPVLREVR